MTYASVNNSIRQRLGVPYHEIFAVHVDDLDYESGALVPTVCASVARPNSRIYFFRASLCQNQSQCLGLSMRTRSKSRGNRWCSIVYVYSLQQTKVFQNLL